MCPDGVGVVKKVKLKHLDLFSGIGGFALAARWAGFETIQFVEYEPYARKVLAKNFPDVPIAGDIFGFDATKYMGVGLLTGGFPCQPFSVAGKQHGKEDDRAIWPEMFRVIREARPTWIIGENVSGIIKMELDNVLSDLEGEGYTTQALVIPATSVDAKHRRDRVWILAHADSIRCEHPLERQDSFRESISGNKQTTGQPQQDLANSERIGQQGQGESKPTFCTKKTGKGETTRVVNGGGQDLWAAEPSVGRVAHGISSRVDRLKGLGNAIVPQVAYEIMRCLK
jgi:DNA (cytosine-5)-methyltransferase 1